MVILFSHYVLIIERGSRIYACDIAACSIYIQMSLLQHANFHKIPDSSKAISDHKLYGQRHGPNQDYKL